MISCVCNSRMCDRTQHSLQLRDEERGVGALFSVSEAAPGQMKVWVLKNDRYFLPTHAELAQVLAHPDAEVVQLNLILTALETWPSWRRYADEVLFATAAGDVS